jgi:DNA-binding ferritin-like protein
MQADTPMSNLLTKLMLARNVAHMWHWKVKSFALHMALGELYDGLTEMMDDIAEMYMGTYGQDAFHVEISQPNGFSEQDPLEFVNQLNAFLHDQHDRIPQDGFIVNKYEELQAMVSKIKYKMENLK